MTSTPNGSQRVVIRNTVPRRDALGQIIDAHDGRVIRFGDRFYWYGTTYGGTDGFGTTNRYSAYSSTDLTNWTQESPDLLPGAPTGVYYRPHVVFHQPSARYVLWYNWYPSLWNGRYGVATAMSPGGPFTIVTTDAAMAYGTETSGNVRGRGDHHVFVAPDGQAYIAYTTIIGHRIAVERLTPDYLGSTLQATPPILAESEAPGLFGRGPQTYLVADRTCAFCAEGTGARVYAASTPIGGYAFQQDINRSGSRYPAAGAVNGDRTGAGWGNGGGWNDDTQDVFPDELTVEFDGPKTIDRIELITLLDDYAHPVEPTLTTTFSRFGITAFAVQYRTGQAWTTVTGGDVTANNRVWRRFDFAPVTTTAIRVLVRAALAGFSRIVELEAWQVSPRLNVAAAANGGSAVGSSEYSPGSVVIAAQQTHIAEVPGPAGTSYLWMADRWGSRPDGVKGHDFQYWSPPLTFDADGRVGPLLSFRSSFTLDIAQPRQDPAYRNLFHQLYRGRRNDYSGTVGFEFVPSAAITVTGLGRPISGAMSGSHLVRIWRTSDRVVVASATVGPASAVDWLGYAYQRLATPITLTAGIAYRIASLEAAGGDAWYDTDQEAIGLDNRSLPMTVTGKVWAAGNAYPAARADALDSGHATATLYTGVLPERSAPTVDQAPTANPELSWSDLSGPFQRLQAFRPSGTGLARIDLQLFRVGSPAGPLTVRLFTLDSASRPVGVPLFAVDLLAQTMSSATTGATVSVHPNLTGLTAGAPYGVLLASAQSAASRPAYGFRYSDAGLYPAGAEYYSPDAGRSWHREPGRTLGFATFRAPSPLV